MPIWRDGNCRIIDGRNRWIACQLAGVECVDRRFDGDDEAVRALVKSMNLMRRGLNAEERAAAAEGLLALVLKPMKPRRSRRAAPSTSSRGNML